MQALCRHRAGGDASRRQARRLRGPAWGRGPPCVAVAGSEGSVAEPRVARHCDGIPSHGGFSGDHPPRARHASGTAASGCRPWRRGSLRLPLFYAVRRLRRRKLEGAPQGEVPTRCTPAVRSPKRERRRAAARRLQGLVRHLVPLALASMARLSMLEEPTPLQDQRCDEQAQRDRSEPPEARLW